MPILLGSLIVSSGGICGVVLNLSFLFPHFNDPSSLVFRKLIQAAIPVSRIVAHI